MPQIEENSWLSLHIYVQPPLEIILVNCLIPVAEILVRKEIIKKWFFIRYYDIGMHIRFRVLFAGPKLKQKFQGLIVKKIESFINHFKLVSSTKEGIFISIENYNPEYARYGGEKGILIAEKLFHSSSEVIGDILKARHKYDYKDMLLEAAVINYIMIFNFIKKKHDLCDFLLFSYDRWLPFANYNAPIDVRSYHKDQFEKMLGFFLPTVTHIHNKLTRKEFTGTAYNKWNESTRNIAHELLNANLNAGIANRSTGINRIRSLWPIYDSYVHMNNNRLGINNRDESLNSFILINALKEIA